MILGRKKVKIAGYDIGQQEIQLNPDKIEAVNGFPTPAKRQDLKSSMGLINQFRQFNQPITKRSYLLKPLLSSKVQYIWLPEHQIAFEDLKKELSVSPSIYLLSNNRHYFAPRGIVKQPVLKTGNNIDSQQFWMV